MQRMTGGCFLSVAGCSGVVGGGVLSAEDIVWKIYVECKKKKRIKKKPAAFTGQLGIRYAFQKKVLH
jgi:hypothetical protein